jgi:hypothetical protein
MRRETIERKTRMGREKEGNGKSDKEEKKEEGERDKREKEEYEQRD